MGASSKRAFSIASLLAGSRPIVMGILNVTPDSFSDGGRYYQPKQALQQALSMIHQGADVIDIGGESTRPGAVTISEQQELDRVIPIIEAIRAESNTPVSIDTSKPKVMGESVKAGASLINDVNGLTADGAIEMLSQLNVPACIMHRRGTPNTMQENIRYDHVVDSVIDFFKQQVSLCKQAGVKEEQIILDPGIGFAKLLSHNLQCLAGLPLMTELGYPLLVGVSRKSLIGDIANIEVDQRMPASVALACQAVMNGAKIVRVHDVAPTYQALQCVEAVRNTSIKKNE